MLVLGINEDRFDSGVTLADENAVLFAANEERYTRRKGEGGFPYHALQAAFHQTGAAPEDVTAVYTTGWKTPPVAVRLLPGLHTFLWNTKRLRGDSWRKWLLDGLVHYTPVSKRTTKPLATPWMHKTITYAVQRRMPPALRHVPVHIVEHHRAHALAAWYLSGHPKALALTADGFGDGVCLTVSSCTMEEGVQRLHEVALDHSFGLFFEALAEALGFLPCRDEGKLTGLAAHGDPHRVPSPTPFEWVGDTFIYSGPRGRACVQWLRHLHQQGVRAEDLCAWAQDLLEHFLTETARVWLRRTGHTVLVAAGGIFANVKLNQRLHELPEVAHLFVCPNMGDGGLSTGAVCEAWLQRRKPPEAIRDVFWGDRFTESDYKASLESANLRYARVQDVPELLADHLAQGKLVARFDGAMEWGPRALGNRSILAATHDASVVARLNHRLRRSDFMPFAPAVLAEDAALYVQGWEKAAHAAEFMTVTFACTAKMHEEHPAVVHVDGTARAQLVRRDANPNFYAVLAAYKRRTGHGILLNTSFNIHEEPIVRTPEGAVDTFLRAGLDYLALGPFVAEHPNPQ
jgi:carbamoyltransferase